MVSCYALCSPGYDSEKMELETIFFNGSNYQGNIHGFSMNHGIIYTERPQEIGRRQTSNAPNSLSEDSLIVSVKRASELTQNNRTVRPFTMMLLKTYRRMGIMSNNDLHLTLCRTRDDKDLKTLFINKFDEVSGSYGIIIQDSHLGLISMIEI